MVFKDFVFWRISSDEEQRLILRHKQVWTTRRTLLLFWGESKVAYRPQDVVASDDEHIGKFNLARMR
ncbi:MAG: hypothetical protein JRF52_13375 [Deltaproteobacteria bacterium]|nr:hypothetical protein [Deltaproteobacteria bacterium]